MDPFVGYDAKLTEKENVKLRKKIQTLQLKSYDANKSNIYWSRIFSWSL